MPVHLDQEGNPYIHARLYNNTAITKARRIYEKSANIDAESQQPFAPYLAPYRAARLVDATIDSVKASTWTRVTSDDGLVRHLLEVYFLHDHPYIPCFHKDLFLRDMAAGRGQFCSSILVNAILASGCVWAKSSTSR